MSQLTVHSVLRESRLYKCTKKVKKKLRVFSVSSKSMYTFELELPFATERHAEIVLNSVVQDEEPRSGSMVERFTFCKVK